MFKGLFKVYGTAPLFDFFADGEPVKYLPLAGSSVVELTAIISIEKTREEFDIDSREKQREIFVTICKDADCKYGGIMNPSIHAAIEYHGEKWSIDGVETTEGLHRLRCVRDELIEHSAKGFRE